MALPYGVIMNTPNGDGHLCSINQTIFGNEYGINISATRRDYFNDEKLNFKPYLRPMSSMTEKEKAELLNLLFDKDAKHFYIDGDGVIDSTMSDLMEEESIYPSLCPINMVAYTNWLLENHFDFIGLIPKGLAIEVTKDDNPYE